jgi:methylmalonyl-CoA carboxyltransferase 5S subunit
VFNVMMGDYKVLTGEFADLMLGYYGATLGQKNHKVVELAAGQTKKDPISVRPADLIKPEWEKLRSEAIALDGCNGSDEDVITYAQFPQVAPKFFKTRPEGPKNPRKEEEAAAKAKPAAAAAGAAKPAGGNGHGRPTGPVTYNVNVGGRSHKVTVTPGE